MTQTLTKLANSYQNSAVANGLAAKWARIAFGVYGAVSIAAVLRISGLVPEPLASTCWSSSWVSLCYALEAAGALIGASVALASLVVLATLRFAYARLSASHGVGE